MFRYSVTLSSGIVIKIFQRSDKKDAIHVSCALFLSKNLLHRLIKKMEIELGEILSELQLKLAPIDGELKWEEESRRIKFYHPIYYDALTKDRFVKAINAISKAFKITKRVLIKKYTLTNF